MRPCGSVIAVDWRKSTPVAASLLLGSSNACWLRNATSTLVLCFRDCSRANSDLGTQFECTGRNPAPSDIDTRTGARCRELIVAVEPAPSRERLNGMAALEHGEMFAFAKRTGNSTQGRVILSPYRHAAALQQAPTSQTYAGVGSPGDTAQDSNR